MIMIWSCLLYYAWDGPAWPLGDTFDPNCQGGWYRSLLYVSTVIDEEKQVYDWSPHSQTLGRFWFEIKLIKTNQLNLS